MSNPGSPILKELERDAGAGPDALPASDSGEPARNVLLSGRLLLLVGLLVYANSLGGTFVYDDMDAIVGNAHIRQLWPIWDAWKAPPLSPLAGRPVVSLSFAFTYALGGLNPWIHHTFNIAVHLLSGFLLFKIVLTTLERTPFRERFAASSAAWLSCIIAAIWMVHPLQTESVTYLTQRTELLVGLFYLLTLYCSIRAWGPKDHHRWTAAAIACCALGMGSKEVMVSAPLVVLLYDRTFVSGSLRAAIQRHWGLYVGLAASWLVLAGITSTSPRGAAVGFNLGIGPLDYLRTQTSVIAHYLRLSFWPHPLVLSYSDWPIARQFTDVAPQALLILLLAAGTLVALVRNSWMGFLGAWFFMILAPSSSFVPIVTEIAAERRMYLPLAAVVILVVVGGHEALRRLSRHRRPMALRTGTIAAILAGVVLAGFTVRRNFYYWSAVSLWQDNVDHRPHDAFARTELGGALLRTGEPRKAERELTEAVRLRPGYGLAHLNLGASRFMQNDLTGAREAFTEALAIDPNSEPAHTNMGLTLMKEGRTTAAIPHFREAVRLAPRRAKVHTHLGRALIEDGQLDDGIRQLEESLLIQPDREVEAYLAQVKSSRQRG